MNLKELQDLIETGIGMVVATRDADLCPDICEGSGVLLQNDGRTCTVFVSSQRAKKSLENIRDNQCIAISLSRPCTYQAYQIKGRVANVRSMYESETKHSQTWLAGYRKEIQLIGVMNRAAQGIMRHSDTAIEVLIEHIFIQTPGPHAGKVMELP